MFYWWGIIRETGIVALCCCVGATVDTIVTGSVGLSGRG